MAINTDVPYRRISLRLVFDSLIFVWDEFRAHYGDKILLHTNEITGKSVSCSA